MQDVGEANGRLEESEKNCSITVIRSLREERGVVLRGMWRQGVGEGLSTSGSVSPAGQHVHHPQLSWVLLSNLAFRNCCVQIRSTYEEQSNHK